MELTNIQRKLLKILKESEANPLTVRDIQNLLGLSSPSLVHHHILQLEKKKFISRNPSNPKDYKILQDPDTYLSYVNLYGMATCGPKGTLLSGDPITRIPLSPKFISFNIEDAFMVEAIGDSMEPGIHEGDFLIGKAQPTAENGDIIVCSLNSEIMVKQLLKGVNEIFLVSNNKKYDPIIVGSKSNFVIEGIVKGIICSHK
ncbi:MAG TPA: peptidase S24 [Bacteroidales bacterium]|nr:peptidase S24 [Bacteroidales bacterium]